MLTDILHHKFEPNDVKIKTEIFEENEETQSETNKTCEEGIDNTEKILKDVKIKSEICETNNFKPTEYQVDGINKDNEIPEVFIKVEDKTDHYIEHEIGEIFMVKELYTQEDYSGIHNVAQQEPFCNQNGLFNQKGPYNPDGNKNDFNAVVSMCTQNQELQNVGMIEVQKFSKTYLNKEGLEIKHRIRKKKSHICDICQKTFNRGNHLKRHKLTHSGEKPHACDICQRKFSQISVLKTHKLVHTGEKPYSCDVCQKTFGRKGDLKIHKLVHTNERPYVCNVCQKAFNRMQILRNHQIVHSGDRPHTCDVCQKMFKHSSTFTRHKLTHKGGKLCACVYPSENAETLNLNEKTQTHPRW